MNQNQQDSHKRFASVWKIASAVFPIIAAIIAVTFFIAMKSDYDSTIGHFERNSFAFTAAVVLSVIAAAVSAGLMLLSKKSASLRKDPEENPATVFGAILCALMSIACMIDIASGYALGVVSKFDIIYGMLVPFAGVSMILSLIGSLKFSAARKITAILAVLALNVSMFADYFDFTLPLNSPVRHFVTVVKAALLLYFLSEARYAFGAESRRLTLTASVLASGVTATVVLGYSAGAILAFMFGGIIDNPNPAVYELAFMAAVGIHAAGRTFTMIPAIGKYIPPVTEEKNGGKKEKTEENK